MRSTGGGPLPRRTLKPAQHWDWPSPTPYSQGLRCGPWLFVGGQAALDEDGNISVDGLFYTAVVGACARESGILCRQAPVEFEKTRREAA